MNRNDINNNTLPKTTPSCYSFNINFALGNPYVIDLRNDISMNAISKTIQGIWIDNLSNNNNLTVSVLETQQNINIMPQSQGIYPLFLPHSGGQITISTLDNNAQIVVILIDIPTDYMNYSLGNSDNVNISGISTTDALNVIPSNTQATPIFTSPANSTNENINIAAQNIALVNNPVFTTQIILSNSITSAIPANTIESLIPSQTAPLSISISNILINMSSNTTLATADLETINFMNTNGNILFSINLYIPAAAGTNPVIFNIPGFLIPSNSGLEYNISTALATGNIDLVINYNITNL